MTLRVKLLAGLCLLTPALAGCDAVPPACPLATQSRMTVIQLFFGRDMPDGGRVSDADWADFAASTITPRFPDGFTVFDGTGQWRNPASMTIGREGTKIVLIAVPQGTDDMPARLRAVSDAYRARFHQEAVGVLNTNACGAF